MGRSTLEPNLLGNILNLEMSDHVNIMHMKSRREGALRLQVP